MFDLGRIGIIGGGSWATANAKIIQEKSVPINWYIFETEIIDYLQKHGHNPNYLSDVSFDTSLLNLTNDINLVVKNSDTLFLITPAAFLKNAFEKLTETFAGKTVVSAIKGIVPGDNLLVGEYMHLNYGVAYSNLGIITGPCHAEEVALERLSYLTIAFQHPEKANALAHLYQNHFIKTTLSDDIIGTEYAAVLKNIYALASGVCSGLGYGDNFQAVLISNAIRELKRFTDTVYPINRDIKDSAYLGDLLVTAYSQFSRNRYFGTMIGKGYSIKHIKNEMNMVAEGYYASDCLNEINKKWGVEMPIASSIYQILYEKKNPKAIIEQLTHKLT
jgi:glycerol-3-phosphate dehydrogenase (NAD(P)+)